MSLLSPMNIDAAVVADICVSCIEGGCAVAALVRLVPNRCIIVHSQCGQAHTALESVFGRAKRGQAPPPLFASQGCA